MARSKPKFAVDHYDFLQNKILIFDGMNIAYASYYANQRLSYKGKSTSMIYGVPQTIRSYIEQEKPQKVYVVWDGDKHPKRLELCPGYKSHREKKRDPEERVAFLRQIRRVQKALYYLGVCQVRNDNVEGDDMIYKLVKKHKANDTWIRIVSGDGDFDQLLCKTIDRINPRTKGPHHYSLLHIENPIKHYKQVLDAHIILGCSSDDIPGYRGIGPVKCRAFFEKFDSIRDFLDNPKASFSGIDKEKLRELYKKNKILIDLEYFDRKYNLHESITYHKEKRFPRFNSEKWRLFCIKYNLKTFQTTQFIKTFNP